MRSLAEAARTARHMAVLDAATLEFNQSGAAGASLAMIARRVGLSRAALYNYCADRQDLVHQCYLRTCGLVQTDLHRAQMTQGSGLDKVTAFLRLTLDTDHPPVAALTELGFLSPEQEASTRAARAENAERLRNLLAEGIADGSIRPCDLGVVSQAIFGILTWKTLSRVWAEKRDPKLAPRLAAVIPGLVSDGVLTEGTQIRPLRIHIHDILCEEPRTERDERLEALAREGSRLFNRRGIDGVSLDDVAAALGATKGSVYHYFDSKPAFVAFCYDRAFKVYERIMDAAEQGANGLEATKIAIELNVEAQLTDVHTLWMTTGLGSLPAVLRKKLLARTNELLQRSVGLAARGIKDGTLRPCDVPPVKVASAGAFSQLSQWLPEDDERTPSQIAAEVSSFLFRGLRNRDN